MNAYRMPKGCFCDGGFFFGCPCCRFWEGGMFCGCPSHYRRQEECLLDARGLFLRRGGGVLWLPRSLCETGAMGRCWDGILGYFCNVFSWAKLPASKLVGLESWFKNKFALSSCILNLSVFINVSHAAAVGGSVVGVVG